MKSIRRQCPQFITDKTGNKKILEKLELEDICLYDAVKARKEKTIPFNRYLQRRRNKNA